MGASRQLMSCGVRWMQACESSVYASTVLVHEVASSSYGASTTGAAPGLCNSRPFSSTTAGPRFILAHIHAPSMSRSFGGISRATQERLDVINEQFAEAREEIEGAREDAETVYFNESAEEARKLVKNTIREFETLLELTHEDEKPIIMRSMGLKMEQLKAEIKELDHLHDDD